MNPSIAWNRLCWKEFRQTLPLLGMLAVVGFLLQVLAQIASPGTREWNQSFFFLGVPGLFAAGVGALLVSQEKDARTLQWLASLPVSRNQIVRAKYTIGLIGLVSVWMISFAYFASMRIFFSQGSPWELEGFESEGGIAYWILHSLFVFTLSFATAWYFRSTLVGLIALVGITALVSLASPIISNVVMNQPPVFNLQRSPEAAVSISTMVGFTLVTFLLGWRYGIRSFSAASIPKRVAARSIASPTHRKGSIADRKPVQPLFSALVWQFSRQNQIAMMAIVVALVLATTLWRSGVELLLMVGAILGHCAICGLGVLTFQGDMIQNRIRFLADRGVSPHSVWLSRIFMPLSLLAAVILGYLALDWTIGNGDPRMLPQSFYVVTGALLLFATTQWFSQQVRSPVLAATLSPLIGLLSLFYCSFVHSELSFPFYSLVVVAVVPLLMSYLMTQRWMDGRFGWRYWAPQGLAVFLMVVVPLLPYFYLLATVPVMPRADREYLASIAPIGRRLVTHRISLMQSTQQTSGILMEGASNSPGGPGMNGEVEVVFVDPEPAASPVPGEESMQGHAEDGVGMEGMLASPVPVQVLALLKKYGATRWEDLPFSDQRKVQLEWIEWQINCIPLKIEGTIEPCPDVINHLKSEIIFSRLKLEDEPEWKEGIDRIGRSFRAMLEIAKRLRLHPTFRAQTEADLLDIWLLEQMEQSVTRKLLDEPLADDIIQHLNNSQDRNKGRLQAIANQWTSRLLESPISPNDSNDLPISIRFRKVSYQYWLMKEYLMAPNASARAVARERLAKEFRIHEFEFAKSVRTGSSFPCALWFGEWEERAKNLRGTTP